MSRKASRKRGFDPISLSFLDVISCGFGAVVLIFLILDHSISTQNEVRNPELLAEVNLLDEEILEGEEGLVRVRNTISDVDLQMVEAQGLARAIEVQVESIIEAIAQLENESTSSQTSVDDLQDEIKELEEELERLREEENVKGTYIRKFVGDGNRQYLTGLILGGSRILILVDISASMLDDTLVNIIRRRNMSDDAKINSEKWKRVRRTVEWLVAQLPPPSQYQIYLFNSQTSALLAGTEGEWLEVADQAQLERAIDELARTIPRDGTNMEQLFVTVKNLVPQPNNIYMITDGLPTLGRRSSSQGTISGRDRERLFEEAVEELPDGVPVNIILAPLEGDPMAASLFWQLAISTGGSFLNPSADWP